MASTAPAPAPAPRSSATAAVFSISVVLMALKPLLLHSTGSAEGSSESGGKPATLPPAAFQLGAELTKVAICCMALVGHTIIAGRPAAVWRGWRHSVSFVPPAAIYLLMNVLTVRAARLLPPPTFQLLANTKILCTAIASRIVMGRQLAPAQWLAMLLLTAGVALGQWRGGEGAELFAAPSLGAMLMLINSWLSSLGGVCTERVLKAKEGAQLSIFASNLHMASHTLIWNGGYLLAAGAGLFGEPSPGSLLPPLSELRLSRVDVVALCNEAMNGILISLLMRRIDSIAKNYAFSASVFVTAGLTAVFLDHRPAWNFYLGALVTLASMWLYARAGRAPVAPAASKDKKAD